MLRGNLKVIDYVSIVKFIRALYKVYSLESLSAWIEYETCSIVRKYRLNPHKHQTEYIERIQHMIKNEKESINKHWINVENILNDIGVENGFDDEKLFDMALYEVDMLCSKLKKRMQYFPGCASLIIQYEGDTIEKDRN